MGYESVGTEDIHCRVPIIPHSVESRSAHRAGVRRFVVVRRRGLVARHLHRRVRALRSRRHRACSVVLMKRVDRFKVRRGEIIRLQIQAPREPGHPHRAHRMVTFVAAVPIRLHDAVIRVVTHAQHPSSAEPWLLSVVGVGIPAHLRPLLLAPLGHPHVSKDRRPRQCLRGGSAARNSGTAPQAPAQGGQGQQAPCTLGRRSHAR